MNSASNLELLDNLDIKKLYNDIDTIKHNKTIGTEKIKDVVIQTSTVYQLLLAHIEEQSFHKFKSCLYDDILKNSERMLLYVEQLQLRIFSNLPQSLINIICNYAIDEWPTETFVLSNVSFVEWYILVRQPDYRHIFGLCNFVCMFNVDYGNIKEEYEEGLLEVMKMLYRTFKLTKEDYLICYLYRLEWCCERGFLQIAKWIHEKFELTREKDIKTIITAFNLTCKHGRSAEISYDIVVWLIHTFNLTREEFMEGNGYAFCTACSSGKFRLIKRLYELFKPTKEEFDGVGGGNLLSYACNTDNLEMIKWIHETFKTTYDDCKKNDYYAFKTACHKGRIEVVKWLINTFNLTSYEIISSRIFIELANSNQKDDNISYISGWLRKITYPNEN
jgi:hypothetical protein